MMSIQHKFIPSRKQAIIIMAKVPASGTVKTRLQPFLTGEQCRELATCFLQDSENKMQRFYGQTIIAFSPKHKRVELETILHYECILIEQKGENLGAKMANAFDYAFRKGFETVLMVGTDSPTIPDKFIHRAFDLLEAKSNAVLGKAEDGGYYLIGLNALKKEVFNGVDWSTENTFEQMAENLANADLKPEVLQTWYDVDFPQDLMRLKSELENNPGLAPETAEWLKKI